jgi:hypothetical protein
MHSDVCASTYEICAPKTLRFESSKLPYFCLVFGTWNNQFVAFPFDSWHDQFLGAALPWNNRMACVGERDRRNRIREDETLGCGLGWSLNNELVYKNDDNDNDDNEH